MQILKMRRHHRRKIRRQVYQENRNHRIHPENRENRRKVQPNGTFAAQVDIQVIMKKPPSGRFDIFVWPIFPFIQIDHCSISNYPNYESHMPPPARFSDTSGEKKTSANSPRIRSNTKLQREAFQINVQIDKLTKRTFFVSFGANGRIILGLTVNLGKKEKFRYLIW